ncbi:MAG: hypothetical protein JO215_12300 [Ktedonobacteraceae bacterium]|nr:hypothetical protein [Ktedonobacteraceae bacterium]
MLQHFVKAHGPFAAAGSPIVGAQCSEAEQARPTRSHPYQPMPTRAYPATARKPQLNAGPS